MPVVAVNMASWIITILLVSSCSLSKAYVFVSVHNSDALKVVSSIVGWAYFAAWSVSFYPQIYENWRRKRYWKIVLTVVENCYLLLHLPLLSVIGLNFDFLSLNIVGFLLYSIFNIGLYAVPGIQVRFDFSSCRRCRDADNHANFRDNTLLSTPMVWIQ